MNNFNKIVFFLPTGKDWLKLMASLFLWCLIPFAGNCQENQFIPAKVKDTVLESRKEIIYIALPKDTITAVQVKSTSALSFLTDSLTDGPDTVTDVSSWIPGELSYLVENKIDTAKVGTFFYPHSLQVKKMEIVDRKKGINNWAFILIITGFLLFAGVQFSYSKRMLQIYKAFGAERFLNQLMRGSDLYKERISYSLFVIFLLIMPLYFFEFNRFYGLFALPRRPFTEILFYLELFFVNVAIYALKVITIMATGRIFKTKEISAEYLMTQFIFSLVEGLVILAFIPLIVFSPHFPYLQISLLVILAIYCFQLIRGFSIGIKNTAYSFPYLVVFFFSLEVLPILFLIKVFSITAAS